MYEKDQLGVGKIIKKLLKVDRNELRFQFHCGILIHRKCPRKTHFNTQCPYSKCIKSRQIFIYKTIFWVLIFSFMYLVTVDPMDTYSVEIFLMG